MKEQTFTSIYTGEESFLSDHKVKSEKILPGVAYLELARAAGEVSSGAKITQIKNVAWLRPVKVNGTPEKIHIRVSSSGREMGFVVYSQKGEKEKLHSQGKLSFVGRKESVLENFFSIRARLTDFMKREECYRIFLEKGLEYGKSFQGIEELYYSASEALSRISLPKEEGFLLSPGLLDSALQTCLGLSLATEDERLALPYSVREVNIYADLPETVWCHVRKGSSATGGKLRSFDIVLFDEKGKPLLDFIDFTVVPVNTPFSALKAASEKVCNTIQEMLYIPVWKRMATGMKQPERSDGRHCIVAGQSAGSLSHKLKEILAAGNCEAEIIKELNEIPSQITNIYLLQGLYESSGEASFEEGLEQRELSVFRAVKKLMQCGYSEKQINITVLTCATQMVLSSDKVQADGSGIIGFMGSLAKEQPLWNIRVIDLESADPDVPVLEKILCAPFDKQGSAVSARGNFLYRQSLHPLALTEGGADRLKEYGTYVILGGAGGIGKVTTAHLVRKYKAQVIWLGRSPLNEKITAALDEIEKLGVRPEYVQCDACNKSSVERAYREIKATHHAIHGLYHSAIVLNDMLVRNMGEEDFLNSFKPKSQACHYLVETFRQAPLDFICFYSSVQSQINAAGQANYSAGCTYKDSFARSIKERYNIPAYIINWGYWGEVGVVSSDGYRQKMERTGIGSISAEEGMEILGRVLSNDYGQVAAIRLSPAVIASTGFIDPLKKITAVPQVSGLKIMAADAAAFIGNPKEYDALKEICSKGLLQVLLQLRLLDMQEEGLSSEELGIRLGIGLKYQRLFREFLNTLKASGYLEQSGTGLVIDEKMKQETEIFRLDEAIEALGTYTNEYSAHLELVKRCLESLDQILTGKVKATDVLFPGGSLQYVERIYKGNSQADYFNDLLSGTIERSISECLSRLETGEKIRILEVGAGTGGTSEIIFKRLAPYKDQIEYVYTDLSRSFLFHGENTYKSIAPYLQVALLNIEQSPVSQGLPSGAFDLVIGANVVHATKDVALALRNIKALLKKGGILIMNEIARTEIFSTLTFGLLDGWWFYEDEALRLQGSPGLSSESWKVVLSETGFVETITFPEGTDLTQQIIAAKSDGIIELPVVKATGTPASGHAVKSSTKAVAVKSRPVNDPENLDKQILELLLLKAGEVLKMQPEQIDLDTPLTDYGIDSILGLNLIKGLNDHLGTAIPTTILFDYPTINNLCKYLKEEYSAAFGKKHGEEVAEEMMPAEEEFFSIQPGKVFEEASQAPDKGTGKKLWLTGPGSVDDIQVRSFEPLPPASGQVLVEIHSFSLNFGDLLCAKGLYPTMPPYPFSPGFEAAGVVKETGEGVTRFRKGDAVIVMGDNNYGMHATHVTVAEDRLFNKPDTLSFAEACSLPVVSTTMIEAFRRMNLREGETILVQTATGGTGLATLQLAKHKGARVIATAGSEAKLSYLRSLGIADVINYQEQDFETEVKRITAGRGVDVVINTLSGENVQKGINCLAKRGRYVELSMTAIKSANNIDMSRFSNNQTFIGLDLRRLLADDPGYAEDLWRECLELIGAGVLTSTIYQEFSFENFRKAYRCLENRGNIGKVVVNVAHQPQEEDSATAWQNNSGKNKKVHAPDIAIIGMSGQFGWASDLDVFWDALKSGKSLIEEVPADRWDLKKYYSPDPGAKDKVYCRWGSFLRDIDKFDASFFRISGIEAENMDPQQRVFMQHCWKALEDAAINPDELNSKKCAVYVGAVQGDYLHSFGLAATEASSFWGNSTSVLASRISYYLNLKGPAIAVDTACSSSLVAMDMGCKSLQMGETDLVISGGISIFITPEFYKQASRAGMLSPDGKCHTFDKRANGFVPGEGVGVVVLKRLEDAVRDGDPVYGVIKGILTNQDGTTSGITAPSIVSQKNLETEVYDTFGINPETISYVEAHGTGTSLGDPIEFQALNASFRAYTDKKQYCGLGSVKSNVGHTVMAAGIAGVIKVLLALRYKQLPPTIHYKECNPMIQLSGSPFRIQEKLEYWETRDNMPRRATVSSFGFSGTNAHLVLEEFTPIRKMIYSGKDAAIITLSARNGERLKEMVRNLVTSLQSNTEATLHEVAYTLQTGRKPMEERLAFVAKDRDDLISRLTAFLEGKEENIFRGNTKKEKAGFLPEGEAGRAYLANAVRNKEHVTLAQLWVKGAGIDWRLFYSKNRPSKIHLPAYPFARERYWITAVENKAIGGGNSPLHPLLHVNESDLNAQKFTSQFTGEEYFFRDHEVKGEKLLPGVAYLEWAREAGERSIGRRITQLKDVTWLSPVKANNGSGKVSVTVYPEGDAFGFEVFSGKENSEQVHCQGILNSKPLAAAEGRNIQDIRNRLAGFMEGAECYRIFRQKGLNYGTRFRGMQQLNYSASEALSRITLPAEPGFELRPGLLDSALQTCIGLSIDSEDAAVYLPFGAGEVNIYKALPETIWCYVRKSTNGRQGKALHLDIDILDEQGAPVILFKDFTVLPVPSDTSGGADTTIKSSGEKEQPGLLFETRWERIETGVLPVVTGNRHLILSGDAPAGFCAALKKSLEEKGILAEQMPVLQTVPAGITDVYFLQGLSFLAEETSVEEGLRIRELALFDDLKTLMASGYAEKALNITVLLYNTQKIHSFDKVQEKGSGITGLLGASAKEHTSWNIRILDIDSLELETDTLRRIISLPFDKEDALTGLRKGSFYRRSLYPMDFAGNSTSAFKTGGTYVILGGSGGIGRVTTEYLVKKYQAQVIWLGRRACNRDIEQAMDEIEKSGVRPIYISCDACDRDSIENAYREIKASGKKVNGLFHSAIVLNDMLLKNMSREAFRNSFDPKSLSCHYLVDTFREEPLDFICFYSSLQSQVNSHGQSNYAAGCTYKDSYALSIRDKMHIPAHIINWGYWGEVGIVSSDTYRKRMELMGVGSISPDEGMKVLEQILATDTVQAIAIKFI